MFEGQPKGLFALALANTGERFGYYTMIAVFALFLRANFGLKPGVAGIIYSSFLMFVYFFPLIGGIMADKFGFGRMVTTGIIVMFAGYLLLSVPLGGNTFALIAMLAALLLTISVELGMLRLLGERRRKVFIGAVVLNILTNIPLNLILIWIGSSVTTLAIGELLVLLVETIGYYILVRNWKQSIIYSLLCNATSFLVGALIQLIT